MPAVAASPRQHGPDPALLPLLREIGDLKRVTSAGRAGSVAERAFRSAWAGLVAGHPAGEVALATTARVLAATRLGDLDAEALVTLGLSPAEALVVQRDALGEFAGVLPETLLSRLRGALDDARPDPPPPGGEPALGPRPEGGRCEAPDGGGRPAGFSPPRFGCADSALSSGAGQERWRPGDPVPAFVDALARQPRAGVTCPGRPRIILQPPENHAEHCLVVAVYAVLLAEPGTDRGAAFAAGLAHHLHNAAMPDSGFTGETLLGRHLEPVMARATDRALAELRPDVRDRVTQARAILTDTATPEGRAFHAADVIDRVLEIDQHLAAARLTMDTVLGEMALVHDGPVKPFHDRVLATMGFG